MTKTELEQVRAFVALAVRLTPGTTLQGGDAFAILDAELAKPEAREWRVLAEDYSQCFASEAEANAAADWLRTNDSGNVYVDSRTVGPWERAE
jgi:hypothetical protein